MSSLPFDQLQVPTKPRLSFTFPIAPEHYAFDTQRQRPVHRLNCPQCCDHIRHRRHERAEDVGGDGDEKAVH